MRALLLLAAAAVAMATVPAHARGGGDNQRGLSEQDAAYRATQQGRILPLPMIRARIRVPGATFIGAEFIDGRIYRLKFMRGTEVIWIDVEAHTGRVIGRQ
jgi:hypothetical protein